MEYNNWPTPPYDLPDFTQGLADPYYDWPWSFDNVYANVLPEQDPFTSFLPVSQPFPMPIIAPPPMEHSHSANSIQGWSASSYGSDGSQSNNLSNVNTPASLEMFHDQRKRKREDSSGCEESPETSQAKKHNRRPPTEAAREKTKIIRGDKACLPCQLEKRGCTPINIFDPESPCDRCSKRLIAPGRIVLCCRVNITDLGIFRGAPTQPFAHTLRYLIVGASPNETRPRQIKKLTDADRRSSASGIKVLRLSQGHGQNTLNLKTQQYNPKDGDKVEYTWHDEDGDEEQYSCPPYALADLEHVQITLERFLEHNTAAYARYVLSDADEITKTVFETALAQSEDSKLVELVLRFWVASRFIENPWHVLGPETLGMTPDPRPTSPYHGLIPVTPIMDQQIDNIIIFHLLEPLWTNIRKILRKKLLENKKSDWFELQLALFILLNHVEKTMAHDINFADRYNLTTRFSNPPLIGKVVHAAETLLKYYHNPGINMYYPFHADWKRVKADYGWTDELPADNHETQKVQLQKQFVIAIRNMLQAQSERRVHLKPGMEGYWTTQLYRNDWTPGVVNAYA